MEAIKSYQEKSVQLAYQILSVKNPPNKRLHRQPTARFFKGYAPAKTPLVGGSLADPVAGETQALGG